MTLFFMYRNKRPQKLDQSSQTDLTSEGLQIMLDTLVGKTNYCDSIGEESECSTLSNIPSESSLEWEFDEDYINAIGFDNRFDRTISLTTDAA